MTESDWTLKLSDWLLKITTALAAKISIDQTISVILVSRIQSIPQCNGAVIKLIMLKTVLYV